MSHKYIDRDRIVRLYQSGMTVAETVRETGYSQVTVRRTLKKRGIELRKDNYIDRGKVLALRRAGWTVKDIAGDMGISEDAVREVLTTKG